MVELLALSFLFLLSMLGLYTLKHVTRPMPKQGARLYHFPERTFLDAAVDSPWRKDGTRRFR